MSFMLEPACAPGSLYSSWSGHFAFTTLANIPSCTNLVSPADGRQMLYFPGAILTPHGLLLVQQLKVIATSSVLLELLLVLGIEQFANTSNW
jgi:hypothetical protein